MMIGAATTAETGGPQGAAVGMLRVSTEKITRLMDLVGELSLSVSETVRSSDLIGLDLSEFEKSAHRLKAVVKEVQDAAAELRMTPVEEVFKRMRRLVRELERQTGKEIDLVESGGDTHIDKAVVERLSEALMHVVRNSADHGLETPQDREATGKTRRGRISLLATLVGSEVHIVVDDDGRGLNRERILARARERGLFQANEVPDDGQIWNVIFQPGFSTAEAVTNLSGRGVGMDVLQTAMNELRGRISIDTRPGSGTSVRLSIPLTLAFLDSLVMRVDDRLYAAPIDSVSEIFKPTEEQITSVSAARGQELVSVRGTILPVCRLQTFYGEAESGLRALDEQILVVFNTNAGRFAVPVDEMLDQQQVVMKPLRGHLRHIRASYGCALLASGEIALVIDCEKLRGGGA